MKPYLLVSRIFEPFFVTLILVILGFFKSPLAVRDKIGLLVFVVVSAVIIPFLFMVHAVQHKIVRDWDLKDRKERPRLLALLFIIMLINLIAVKFTGDRFLFATFAFITVWMLGFMIITLFWKISGHTGVNTLAAGLLITWFGRAYWPVFLAIPLVAWARVQGKYHSVAQVIAGILYSLVLLYLFHPPAA
jgi:membrane-associated phospholipid phosphatase